MAVKITIPNHIVHVDFENGIKNTSKLQEYENDGISFIKFSNQSSSYVQIVDGVHKVSNTVSVNQYYSGSKGLQIKKDLFISNLLIPPNVKYIRIEFDALNICTNTNSNSYTIFSPSISLGNQLNETNFNKHCIAYIDILASGNVRYKYLGGNTHSVDEMVFPKNVWHHYKLTIKDRTYNLNIDNTNVYTLDNIPAKSNLVGSPGFGSIGSGKYGTNQVIFKENEFNYFTLNLSRSHVIDNSTIYLYVDNIDVYWTETNDYTYIEVMPDISSKSAESKIELRLSDNTSIFKAFEFN